MHRTSRRDEADGSTNIVSRNKAFVPAFGTEPARCYIRDMGLTIKNFFLRLWSLLWDKELPILLQIVGFILTIFITHEMDSYTSDRDRRLNSFVAQVHSFETDSTTVNVQFGAFADTIIRPELAPANERTKVRAEMAHDRDVAREGLMDSLVRASSDAENMLQTADPNTRQLLQKYEQGASALLEIIRTTDDFYSLKPAYHALGNFLDVQMVLLPALRKQSGLIA